jgi:hypothetical protein
MSPSRGDGLVFVPWVRAAVRLAAAALPGCQGGRCVRTHDFASALNTAGRDVDRCIVIGVPNEAKPATFEWVRPLVRESKLIGQIVNLRPAFLSGLASRAMVLAPEALMTRHLAAVAAGSAFVLPTDRETASV